MTVREVSTREDADGSGIIIRCTRLAPHGRTQMCSRSGGPAAAVRPKHKDTLGHWPQLLCRCGARSDPVMDFAGGSRFATSSVLRMEARDGGCQVRWESKAIV